MNVSHILQIKGNGVTTVLDIAPLTEAIRILAERNIGSLVVLNEDKQVVGILSERDIIRVIGKKGDAALKDAVRTTMTPDPISCRPETTVEEAIREMSARRFRHLPVVVDGRLVGLVSIGDVVKLKIEEAEREAAELRDYIAK